jgi:hypothetical protein
MSTLRAGLLLTASLSSYSLIGCGAGAGDPAAQSPDVGGTIDSGPTEPPPPTEIDGYPAGPYGKTVGMTFPNLTVHGYREATGAWTEISVKDYYDKDGSKGINGLYLTVSAPWCSGCVAEARSMPGMYTSKYKAQGARFLTAVVQDSASKPATQATVDLWISTYKTNYDIAEDGAMDTVPKDASGGGSIALPYNYVINPRTMKITQINSGPFFTGGQIPGLDPLLKKNGG